MISDGQLIIALFTALCILFFAVRLGIQLFDY